MTTWMLYMVLSTGDAGAIETSQYVCEKTALAVASGETVQADVYGHMIPVERAACHGPVGVNPCEVEASS